MIAGLTELYITKPLESNFWLPSALRIGFFFGRRKFAVSSIVAACEFLRMFSSKLPEKFLAQPRTGSVRAAVGEPLVASSSEKSVLPRTASTSPGSFALAKACAA